MKGKIKFDYALENGLIQQELEIEITQAPANRDYCLMVDFGEGEIHLNTFSTNDSGKAVLSFDSAPGLNRHQITDFLTTSFDVRNIRRIRILLKDKPVLEARF